MEKEIWIVITVAGIIVSIAATIGGYALKTVLDWSRANAENKLDKAKKYDEQELKKLISDSINNAQNELKKEIITNMTTFQTESKATFDYWQKMYWEAVDHLKEVEKDFLLLREQNLTFYKYQLINTCKKRLSNGYMTQAQFDRLSELHKIYNALGGNSQGDLYYNKVIALPIFSEHNEDEFKDIELYVEEEDMKHK